MTNTENLQLFEDQPIRTAWNEDEEEWYFSIVDVVGVLSESTDPSSYWRKMKQRLKEKGNKTVTNCHALKMKAVDGKRRLTDVANTEQLLRIIQSIPSKKAEPFKLWLAQVGRERIEETLDPELIAECLVATYERKGYTREWINQRLMAISARKELTDEWKDRGVTQGKEYAILTDELTKAWSGMTTRQYKNHKGLKKESLRDNMSTTELVLNMLAETATREFSQSEKPSGFSENVSVGHSFALAAMFSIHPRRLPSRKTFQPLHKSRSICQSGRPGSMYCSAHPSFFYPPRQHILFQAFFLSICHFS